MSLIFKYGVMSAGKSVNLISTHYDLSKNNVKVDCYKPGIDTRTSEPVIRSRMGNISCPAYIVETLNASEIALRKPEFVLIDEINFFKASDIDELVVVADNYGIEVICYGLLKDIREQLWPASKRLLEVGAKLYELKTNCQEPGCKRSATHNARFINNKIDRDGPTVVIGDTEYKSYCRRHYNFLMNKPHAR